MKQAFKITAIVEAGDAVDALARLQNGKGEDIHFLEVIKYLVEERNDVEIESEGTFH